MLREKLLTPLFLLLFVVVLFSQDRTGYNAMAAKVLVIDYSRVNDLKELEHTYGLELMYRRQLFDFLAFAVPLKAAVADPDLTRENVTIFSIDGLLHLAPFGLNSRIAPYLLGGIGYTWENTQEKYSTIPFGAGINFRVGNNSFLTLQGEYRKASLDGRDNIQIGGGYLYRFGRYDRDKDGVADSRDRCPDVFGLADLEGCPDQDGDGLSDIDDKCPVVAGLAELQGCPDADRDGVIDSEDDCPDEFGLANLKGCPDIDNDGVANSTDRCPEVAGPVEQQGCPDTDGDGLHDGEDDCPTEAGLAANGGCPANDRDNDGVADDEDACPDQPGLANLRGCPDRDGDGVIDDNDRCPDQPGEYTGCPDTDGDGVIDPDDRCPTEAGLVTNKGCPELKEEVKEVLNFAMRNVQFETGRATLKSESKGILDQIVDIMKQYPAYSLMINGHTDSVGDDRSNQVLSEERAKSCYQYLVSKGVSPARITHNGFGESQPVSTNKTSEGRRLNRRVEFDLQIK